MPRSSFSVGERVFLCNPCLFPLQPDDTQRGQIDDDGVEMPLPGLGVGGNGQGVDQSTTAVAFGVGVEDFPPDTARRDTRAVARSGHWSGVDEYGDGVAAGSGTLEGENGARRVGVVEPAEPAGLVIERVQGRQGAVKAVQVT